MAITTAIAINMTMIIFFADGSSAFPLHDNPTRIIFGRGKLDELKNCDLPGKKALLLISNGKSTIKNGYLERVENLLKENIGYFIII